MISSYFTLRKLGKPGDKKPDLSFQRMVNLLKRADEFGRIQFNIYSGAKQKYWAVELTRDAAKLSTQKMDQPDFEIITSQETWSKIASGSLSPLRAFVQGNMRVRGDVQLGLRIFRKLASSSTKK